MYFKIVGFELKKIIFSRKFKFAVLAMLLISLFYSVQEKLDFPKYDQLNIKSKTKYEKTIKDINEFLANPYEYHNGLYKKNPEYLEIDMENGKKRLEYYKSHTLPEYKKNFIQGFSKNFNSIQLYIVLLGLFCSSIISDEKAKNTISFQFTSKANRGTLYNAKYTALIISIAVLIIINIIFSLITNGIILGFSDINGSLQQIRGYEMSTIQMSILKFIIMKSLLLFICSASFACIYIFISSLFKNFLVPYILCILIIANSNVFLYEFNWTYFLPSTYHIFDSAFYSGAYGRYSFSLVLISMFLQSALLYIIGHYSYKRMQIK